MPTAQLSNYPNIEKAIANLIKARWPGIAVDIGDYSKIVDSTPRVVISHGELHSPVDARTPNYEWLYWQVPIHIFFDYADDVTAHNLFRSYRSDMVQLFQLHRYLDDGNPTPPGKNGQADDCKMTRSFLPAYITIDGRDYVQATYELWVMEKVIVTYP